MSLKTKQKEQLIYEEDLLLINAFLKGDEIAFAKIVKKYRKSVYAVAYRFSQNHDEADDLCQETFVKAFQSLATFRKEAALKTWLLRIVTNLSINMKKSGRMNRDSGMEPDENHTNSGNDALHTILEGERKAKLRNAMALLPPKQRKTLILKTYEDLTCEEVARIMNCSPGTVKANIFNALKRLKKLTRKGG